MIDYTNLQKTLKSLARNWNKYQNLPADINSDDLEDQKMALIKAFEICYEVLLKSMRRYLVDDLGSTENMASTKPLIRVANENGLLRSSVDKWFEYLKIRNKVVHEYGIERINDLAKLMPDFIGDAIDMYQTMTGQPWELE